MSGIRGGLGRIVAIGIALALALLLLAAKEATAGKYSVAQCGWHVGADAGWADSTGGAKFRSDAYCATPPGADPFDGAHLKSFTRNAQTVSGTRYARWRWDAPEGTGITRVSGTWWHTLHDGLEQRIGVANWGGGFDVFAAAANTDVTPRGFVAGFSTPMPALEDRLLCARVESKWCSLDPGSWSAVRALTITVEDNFSPSSSIDGDMLAPGWLRGERKLGYAAHDGGAGVKRTEALVDGRTVLAHDHACNVVSVSGELRGTTMRPCPVDRVGYYPISTLGFSDGPHSVAHCATDFAGNVACIPARTILIDNNPPAHPRDLALSGGGEWRRSNDFDPKWVNPGQGAASPIGGATWRITGPAGYNSGAKFVPGRELSGLQNLFVPRAGVYSLSVWLRDEAGNESASSAASLPLRFDDVPPSVAFEPAAAGGALPTQISARVNDAHSGPAAGEIHYRRLGAQEWTELPAKFQRGVTADSAELVARLPSDLGAGTYVFRADAVDSAGNKSSTTRRADGTEMSVRKVAGDPILAVRPAAPVRGRARARIFARLRWHRHRATALTVPFGVSAMLSGRLLDADGAGLAARMLRVVSRPSRGALSKPSVARIETGAHGVFSLRLGPGTSRRVSVSFAGDDGFERAERSPLTLRVRSGVEFHAAPRQVRTGAEVRFSGRVRSAGAPLPRRGKLVAIQYYESAARRWRPVMVVRSDHAGRFRARYRFRYVSGTARIRIRAVALPEERWPYAPGASRSLVVRVSG
ncbi:MAG TPA: Ig-like domain repeat protein [Solirubrobacterales bacterium]|nr:Ig-like domain repeat protein [Solirubrobacterales bacterium]